MTRSEILDFVRKNPTSHMATIEDGEPRVRAMETPLVDDSGLTFLTGSVKSVCNQLIADPSVELCYWDGDAGVQLRIRGRMEKLDDQAMKEHIVQTRFTFLKPIAERFGWEAFILFRLSSGTATTWSSNTPGGGAETFPF